MNTANRRPTVPNTAAAPRAAAWAGAPAIALERVSKSVGSTPVLTQLSLRVRQGECFGLLGPRGAGKTTAMRILATLLRPDNGYVTVLGFDASARPAEVRRRIGYVAQHTGQGDGRSGRDQVVLMARLHGLSRRQAERAADETIAALRITTIAARRSASYSPEEAALIALAAGSAHRPPILLIDDATASLTAPARSVVWQFIRLRLREDAATVFLASSYLQEVETLCDRVAIADAGRVIASGTPGELKAQVSGTLVSLHLREPARIADTALLLSRMQGVNAVRPLPDRVDLEVVGAGVVPALLRVLEEHEIATLDVQLSRPSLDEVFFRHTGRTLRDDRGLQAAHPRIPERR